MYSKATVVSLCGSLLALALPVAVSASALSVSCAGAPTSVSITWTASSTGGIPPVVFLWRNGSTSTTQTLSVAPGTYSMTLQATDASSSVATSTCSAMVAAPAATSTPPSLAAQIQALLAQIAALKAQIAQLILAAAGSGSSGIGTTTAPVITPGICDVGHDIARGDFGDDVKDLQKFLAKHPDIYPEGIVNGFYGPHTVQAVQRWQHLHGVNASGFFGPLTRKAWKEHCDDEDDNDNEQEHRTATSTNATSSTTHSSESEHGKDRGKDRRHEEREDD